VDLVCCLSFRAGVYGTKTGLFSRKINLLFSPVYSRKLKRHIAALFSLVRKKVPKKYAIGHALWTPLRRKTETPLRSACFTAILKISQYGGNARKRGFSLLFSDMGLTQAEFYKNF